MLILAGVAAISASTLSIRAQAPSAVGLWQKVENGQPVAWFVFVERGDGTYEGAIAKLFPQPGEKPDPVCTQCTDDRRGAPLLGIPLVRDMKRNGLRYEGGNILDPRDGKIYRAVMTLSPDGRTLTLRGFLGIELLGKSETWLRLPDSAAKELDRTVVARYMPELLPATRGKPKPKPKQ
jgi:uncharacterized protein (DUF2147 family)